MSFSALAVFAVALLVGAGSPGPSVAAVVSRVLARGFRDVVPFLLALWLGEAVWLTLAVAGLAVVAERFATVFLLSKYAGVAYLLYLAWCLWIAPPAPVAAGTIARSSPWRMMAAGLMVSLGNPKNMVFYLALLPAIVDLRTVGAGGWAALVATMLATLALVDVAWSAAAVQARRFFLNGRTVRLMNRVSASMLAGAAAAIGVR